jgi:hypothetical protein
MHAMLAIPTSTKPYYYLHIQRYHAYPALSKDCDSRHLGSTDKAGLNGSGCGTSRLVDLLFTSYTEYLCLKQVRGELSEGA